MTRPGKIFAALSGALLWLAAALPAAAQTSPNFTFGQVPTVAQWNALFASKQDYLGAAPLLVTGGAMSGPLVTAASLTSAAGLNLPQGAAPTSPNNGDLWTTSAGIYVQINGSTVGPLSSGLPAFGTGSAQAVSITSANTGFANTLNASNTGTLATTGTAAAVSATLAGGVNLVMQATGGATPIGTITAHASLTGGLTISVGAGSLTLANATTSMKIPTTNGTNGQCLTTNGAGTTAWNACGAVTPAALTKTDDTNVTLTLGGTPATALLQATSLTLGWTGTLSVARGGTGAGTFTANGPLIGNGTSAIAQGTRAGNTTVFATIAGSFVSGQCVSIDANLNLVAAGGACTTGGGGGTVNSGTSGQMAYYGSTGTVVSGNPNATIAAGALSLGVNASVAGSVALFGSTSGSALIGVAAAAGSTTFTLPVGNGTNGQALTTNGSGVTAWTTLSGSGTVNSGTSGQFAYYATSTNAVSSNSSFTTSNVLTNNATSLIGVGYTYTSGNLGTISSGTTQLVCSTANYQYYTNNGAHTLTPQAADCGIDIKVTNGASAGAITFSGFSAPSTAGNPLNTTNGNKFLVSFRRIAGDTTYSVYPYQ